MQLPHIKKLTFLSVTCIFLSQLLFGQITQPAGVETYSIRKEFVLDAGEIYTLTNGQKTKAINYADGFGRPLQSIVAAGSPTGKDIVSFSKYDEYGRQPKQWLPFEAATTNGAYNNMSTILTTQLDFYNPNTAASKKIAGDIYPYAESSFETSPLGRVLKVGGVGDSFQLNQH